MVHLSAHRGDLAEVDIQILELGRPVAREHPFAPSANRESYGLADVSSPIFKQVGWAGDSDHGRIRGVIDPAIGETASAVKQQIGRNRDTKAAAHCTKPGKLPLGRKEIAGERQSAVSLNDWLLNGRALHASALNVRFQASDERSRLPVVTGLSAADYTL